jgi:hypothetical protein
VITMTVNESSLLYRLARTARPVVPIAFNRLYSAHHVHHFTRHSLEVLLRSHDLRIDRSWTHNMPLAAIDIPTDGLVGFVLRIGMWGVCLVGDLTGTAYLQTVVARRPAVSLEGGSQNEPRFPDGATSPSSELP